MRARLSRILPCADSATCVEEHRHHHLNQHQNFCGRWYTCRCHGRRLSSEGWLRSSDLEESILALQISTSRLHQSLDDLWTNVCFRLLARLGVHCECQEQTYDCYTCRCNFDLLTGDTCRLGPTLKWVCMIIKIIYTNEDTTTMISSVLAC